MSYNLPWQGKTDECYSSKTMTANLERSTEAADTSFRVTRYFCIHCWFFPPRISEKKLAFNIYY